MLTAVAILNGFPLVEFDSSRYFASSFSFAVVADRPIFYSLFIRLSRGLAPTLWATVLLQFLLTALVMHAFLRVRSASRRAGAWTLVVTLALLTSVAWFTGCIMADLFTGLMFLATVTLLVDPRPGWRAVLPLAVIAFAATAHNSNLLILSLFLIAARAVLAFILINATVCAGLAVIYDRYGGRAIWLVPLVALEILRFEWASAPERRPGSPQTPR